LLAIEARTARSLAQAIRGWTRMPGTQKIHVQVHWSVTISRAFGMIDYLVNLLFSEAEDRKSKTRMIKAAAAEVSRERSFCRLDSPELPA